MASPADKVGILAGGGRLPEILAETCQKTDRDNHIIGFKNFTDAEFLCKHPHSISKLATIGKTVKQLKTANVKNVIFAGKINRPNLTEMIPDIKGAKLLVRLTSMGRLGDDALLSELARFLEAEGFHVIGAHEINPELLSPVGFLTKSRPSQSQCIDIEEGMKILSAMADHDIGQACVMQDGLVLGIEAIEGTSALIKRCSEYKRKGQKPILVKRKKTNQDTRFDLPTIGLHTIELLADKGYGGVALESGATIILDRDAVIKKADEHKIFIFGAKPEW